MIIRQRLYWDKSPLYCNQSTRSYTMIYSLVNTKRSGTAHVPMPASQSFAMAFLMVLIDCIGRGVDANPHRLTISLVPTAEPTHICIFMGGTYSYSCFNSLGGHMEVIFALLCFASSYGKPSPIKLYWSWRGRDPP